VLLIVVNQDHDLARNEFDRLVEKSERQQIANDGVILVANICRWRSLVGEIRKDTSGESAGCGGGIGTGLHEGAIHNLVGQEPLGESTERDH
jgi:hypothetical protein